jgi:uncharacterized protein
MLTRVARLALWRTVALLAVALGFIGVFVPGLPTVPFLLLAAWAAGRGWPALEQWLLNHATHGPAIRRWRERGAVPRKAKWLASATMLASATLLVLLDLPLWLKIAAPAAMLAVACWLWLRPED